MVLLKGGFYTPLFLCLASLRAYFVLFCSICITKEMRNELSVLHRFIFIILNACLYRIMIYVQILHHPECIHLLSDSLSLSLNNYGAPSNIYHDNDSSHMSKWFMSTFAFALFLQALGEAGPP